MTSPHRLATLAAALVAAVSAVRAQAPPANNPPANNPYGAAPAAPPRTPPVSQPTTGTLSSDAAVAASLARAAALSQASQPQYAPYGGYPYYETPAHGYLSGVAEVTTAQGQYLSQVQTARLQQSAADVSKLDLRRRILEESAYEKSLQPTPEQLRQKDLSDAINRARNNPPSGEVWSGRALNALYTAILNEQKGGAVGPPLPLDPSLLRHINLTTGTTTAGSGVLKDLRQFQWPLALLDDPFNAGRAAVEALSRQAATQAASGPVDARTQRDLQKAINALITTLKGQVDDITPTQYVQAMRYLRELNDSTKVLQDPNVSSYFGDKYKATGSNVAELVQGMSNRGLTFAPAGSGDEPYYTALHQALVTYDYGLRQLASR